MEYFDLKRKSVWIGLAAILLGLLQLFGVGGPDLQGNLEPLGRLIGAVMGSSADPIQLIFAGGALLTVRKAISAEARKVDDAAIGRQQMIDQRTDERTRQGLPLERK